jgi:hypothetical protein
MIIRSRAEIHARADELGLKVQSHLPGSRGCPDYRAETLELVRYRYPQQPEIVELYTYHHDEPHTWSTGYVGRETYFARSEP